MKATSIGEIFIFVLYSLSCILATPPQVDQLYVKRAPVIGTPTRDYIEIECSGSGDPAPTYKFRFKGVELKDGDQNNRIVVKDNILTVLRVRDDSDGGIYECLASNRDGTVFREVIVTVYKLGKFEASETLPPLDHVVTMGKHTVLKCPKHSDAIPAIYSWGNIPRDARVDSWPQTNRMFYRRDGALIYASVEQADIDKINNYRGISCLMYNNGQYTQSRKYKFKNVGSELSPKPPFILAFMAQNTIVLKDQEVTFTCGANGRPPPEITWFRDGIRITYNESSQTSNFDGYVIKNQVELKIIRPRKEDKGNFKCEARNERGFDYKEAGLSVQYRPEWIKEIKDVTIPVTNDYVFNCSADGLPHPTYEWYKNGTKLRNGDSHIRDHVIIDPTDPRVLRIKKARIQDNGMYLCLARNKHGSVTTQSRVTIKPSAPKFLTEITNPMYLFKDRVGKILCNPQGGPPPTKTWYKDGRQITNSMARYTVHGNGTLEIQNVQDSDKGVYRCNARNTVGQANMETTVMVVVPTVITVHPENKTVKEGEPIQMVCDATYDRNLELRLDWLHDHAYMKTWSDRYMLEPRVMGAPHLFRIKKSIFLDRGWYTCYAYTQLSTTTKEKSEDSKSGFLTVLAPPDPPNFLRLDRLAPQNSCDRGQVTLKWQLGSDNLDYVRHYFVEYTSDFPDDYNTWYIYDPKVGTGTTVQFTMNRLPGNANLKFRVIAVNSVGRSKPSKPTSPLTWPCKTPEQVDVRACGRILVSVPYVNPQNVTGEGGSPGVLTIKWRKLKRIQQNAPGFVYEVGYKLVGDSKFRKVNKTNVTDSFPVPNAGVFKEYEIYVRSWNRKGPGPPPKTVKVYSGQTAPQVAPSGFRAASVKHNSVELTWNKVQLGTTGNIAGYRIYYWNITKPDRPVITRREKRAIKLPNPEAKYLDVKVEPGEPARASLLNLTAALKYHAIISAYNSGGEGPTSATLVFETNEIVPDIPHNVKMNVYGSVLHLQWESPYEPNGIVTGFIIGIDPPRPGKKFPDQVVLDHIEREYYIRGMKPVTFYMVKIAAMNGIGIGRYYEERQAVSLPDKPGKPKTPRVVPLDADAVNVTYKLPGFGGLPLKFRVYYKLKDAVYFDDPSKVNSKYVENTDFLRRPWLAVKKLQQYQYEFWVVGINELGESQGSEHIVSQPLPYHKTTTSPGTTPTPKPLIAGPGARTKESPWYQSNWFIGTTACVVFILIVLIVILMLINKGGGKYKVSAREKERAGWNGQPTTEFTTSQPYDDQMDLKLLNPPSDYNPPPRYPSHDSLEKKPPSDDQDSLDDYGEDSRFDEGGSFIGQYGEEKRKEAEAEAEEDDDVDYSTFV